VVEHAEFVGVPCEWQKFERAGVYVMIPAAFRTMIFAVYAGVAFKGLCIFIDGFLQGFDFLNFVIKRYHMVLL